MEERADQYLNNGFFPEQEKAACLHPPGQFKSHGRWLEDLSLVSEGK